MRTTQDQPRPIGQAELGVVAGGAGQGGPPPDRGTAPPEPELQEPEVAAEDEDGFVEGPDEIAFEETRGMTLDQILAAIHVGRGSPAPVLGDGFVDVRGCYGAIVIGEEWIPFHDLERILPWPVAAA